MHTEHKNRKLAYISQGTNKRIEKSAASTRINFFLIPTPKASPTRKYPISPKPTPKRKITFSDYVSHTVKKEVQSEKNEVTEVHVAKEKKALSIDVNICEDIEEEIPQPTIEVVKLDLGKEEMSKENADFKGIELNFGNFNSKKN